MNLRVDLKTDSHGQNARPARRNFLLLLALCPVLLTAGCQAATVAAIANFSILDYFRDEVNVMETNYATADYLVSRAGGYVKKHHVIRAMPLQDIQEPRLITHFGKIMPKQVGERMNQLGYKVDISHVWTEVNQQYSPVHTPALAQPDFILGGSYVRKTSSLDVTVRLQDARTGIERASYSYSVPRNGDIRKATETKPVIMRTTPQGASAN